MSRCDLHGVGLNSIHCPIVISSTKRSVLVTIIVIEPLQVKVILLFVIVHIPIPVRPVWTIIFTVGTAARLLPSRRLCIIVIIIDVAHSHHRPDAFPALCPRVNERVLI